MSNQRISEHKSSNSLIGRHLKEYGVENPRLTDNFSFLKKNEEIDSNVYKRTQLGITERAIGVDSRKLFYKEIYIKMNAQIQSTLFKVQILKQL